MPLDFDIPAKRERDRRLRRVLLERLHLFRHTSPMGGIHGRPLLLSVTEAVDRGMGFDDDTHALGLIRDLVNKGLVSQRLSEKGRARAKGEPLQPGHLFLAVTDKGSSLINQEIEPDPAVYDDRASSDEE